MIKHFDINNIGRDFVVGDIHGCFTMLKEELLKVDFNIKKDRLFSVGDLVDRGTESEESVKWIGKPWFHTVRGNHEQMLIDVVNGDYDAYGYIQNGGAWLLGLPECEQKNFAVMFDELPIAIDIETKNGLVGIVHADCPVINWTNLESQLNGKRSDLYKDCCLWDRFRVEHNVTAIVDNVYKVFMGHTPVKEPTILGNCVYIDTGAVFGKKLTLVEL